MGYTGDALTQLVNDSDRIARDAVRELADAAGRAATDTARALAPVYYGDRRHRPGSLRDSYVQSEVEAFTDGVHDGYRSGVESHDYRAKWIEYGTDPHEEDPATKHAIEFTTIDGEKVRARVRHPGTRGQYVVARAMAVTEMDLASIGEPIAERWAERQRAAASRR